MARVDDLKSKIQQLDREELSQFRTWFLDFMQDEWDRQIEADSLAGKLDFLIEKALVEEKARTTEPL
jgi:hypothetical protein